MRIMGNILMMRIKGIRGIERIKILKNNNDHEDFIGARVARLLDMNTSDVMCTDSSAKLPQV